MGLWEFLRQWRGRRAITGVVVSVLLHLLVVTLVLWAGNLPLPDRWRAKPGDALIVELPKPDESPAPGVPDAPRTPSAPASPPVAAAPPPPTPAARPAPPTPPTPAPAKREAPARPTPAAPSPPEQTRTAVRAPEPARPAEQAAESAPTASPQPTEAARQPEAAPAAPQPADRQVASVPPGGAPSAPPAPDMRSALRRGAGGRGQGWNGIEGEPIRLDAVDDDYSAFLEQVRKQIKAKWGYPCVKNRRTQECEYMNARVVVVFGIHKSGKLQVVEVQNTSGYDIYDDYAVTAVRLAAPYPPVPEAMMKKFKAANVGVPIAAQFTYILDNSLTNILR